MKTIAAIAACAVTALVLSATASATLRVGVTEDAGKETHAHAALFLGMLNDVGMTDNRVTILWDPAQPTTIAAAPSLDLWLPLASLHGVRVIFGIYPAHARDLTSSPGAPAAFVEFVRLVAQRYHGQVKDYIIGNEPNVSFFFQPQFGPDGKPVAPATYERILGGSYDALKAIDPSINVIGLGLSPRGNDAPHASSNISTSPVRFIHELGKAYRAGGRTKPPMDSLGFHPYPNLNSDSPTEGYLWPNAGLANLDRIKQAVWDAFAGTGQPTFAESGANGARSLRLELDEAGWQAAIPPVLAGLYFGKENVPAVDEATHARNYAETIRLLACDASVKSINFFHLVDETNLGRWQSGLLRADGSKRPAYDAVKQAIAEAARGCSGKPVTWAPSESVAGARAQFRPVPKPVWWKSKAWSFVASAREEATFTAGIYRVGVRGRRLAAAAPSSRPVLSTKGRMRANWPRVVRFPARRLKPGTYVYVIRIRAATNAQRATVLTSRAFRVAAPRGKRK